MVGTIEFLIFIMCIIFSGYQAYKQGIKKGSSATIDKLVDLKIVQYDKKGNIIPSQVYRPPVSK